MKFLLCSSVQIIFTILAIGLVNTEGAGKQTPHVSYLTPFPRVGRNGGVIWDLEPGYPRVLNALLLNDEPRRSSSKNTNTNTGLWFGPRLGRVQKRGDGIMDDAWSYIILRDLPTYRHIPKYTPRLGRESQETIAEEMEDINQVTSNKA